MLVVKGLSQLNMSFAKSQLLKVRDEQAGMQIQKNQELMKNPILGLQMFFAPMEIKKSLLRFNWLAKLSPNTKGEI